MSDAETEFLRKMRRVYSAQDEAREKQVKEAVAEARRVVASLLFEYEIVLAQFPLLGNPPIFSIGQK